MKPAETFTVIPSLPAALEPLRSLACNLRWAWDHDSIALFRRLDRDLWETTGHNPVLMLGAIDQAQLEAAAADDSFLAHLGRVARDLDAYLTDASTWFARAHSSAGSPLVAYCSAEFGLTECLSIFAGGLGLLAGDHLKSCSDLGVPLVGVGLLYQEGYFRQYLNDAAWQQETYEDNDFHNLPLAPERGPDGAPLAVRLEFPGRVVTAQVWRAQVGRVPLYLLDTNIPENRPDDRDITDRLYGGDVEMRIRQEILLGIGGYRALEALGLSPAVYHMNEGHSAFLALEHTRRIMERANVTFREAREAASASLVFTTHTPVAAGQDYFPSDLTERYLGEYVRSLGLSREDFLALGRQNAFNEQEPFCMTILALRMAASSNGVSRLHGRVSRQMWQGLWPDVPEEEVPIGSVTNGVHIRSWISHEMDQLYDRYLGPRWREEPADQRVWQGVTRIPADELWHAHEQRRERLVAFARRRLRQQAARRGAPQSDVDATDETLSARVLTIGFARRFATYKRATLLFRDPERLARLLTAPERPVQLIFAGKAHPQDAPGKELIRQVAALARQEPFRGRLVFLEDYDVAMARSMVQGCDVWLNTPRRPLEASGTSGMKAVANGVLHLSSLDGWWDEAWRDAEAAGASIGWAIGRGEDYDSAEHQDEVEAEALYDLLEGEVVPTFYDRGADGLPRRWIDRMKGSISTLCCQYNTHRMAREYTERCYLPAADRFRTLAADGMARARALADWRARLSEQWGYVRAVVISAESHAAVRVGSSVRVQARVQLGALTPDDVAVEVYLGRVNADGEIVEAEATSMRPLRQDGEGVYLFQADAAPCRRSGLHGYAVRVLPRRPDLGQRFTPGLIRWADPPARAW